MKKDKKILGSKLIATLPIILGILTLISSCDIFFKKELRQDQKLAYYRHRAYVINDSIKSNAERIKAYKTLVAQASEDKHLITLRKKNMLLSEIYTSIGAEYYDTFRADDAIESCNLAIMLNVENKEAYFNRGCLYELIGNDSLAIDSYTKALEANENFADAYYNRGMIYENNTDFQLAIEDYSQAIKLNPPYLTDVYNNRGNTYQRMKFYDKAINDYTIAIEIDSMKAMTYYNRANAYLQKGMEEDALTDYQKVLQIDPQNRMVIDKIKDIKKDVEEGKEMTFLND